MNIAREALTHLAEVGWTKGDFEHYSIIGYEHDAAHDEMTPIYGDPDGVCMLGALGLAYDRNARFFECEYEPDDYPDMYQATETVYDIILEQFPDRMADTDDMISELQCHIPRFNDHVDTKLDEVIMVLEKAAIKLDELNG